MDYEEYPIAIVLVSPWKTENNHLQSFKVSATYEKQSIDS